jgi:hexulose-6-phosphate isomerase
MEKALKACSVLGADTFLTIPGLVTEDDSYADVYARSKQTIKELVPIAEEYRVNIGLENVWNKFLLSPLEFDRFIDEIGSDYVGIYFDVGNVLLTGYPNHWLKILSSKIKKIHIDDFKYSIGNVDGFVNILEGDVNWPLVNRTLKEISYEGYITAEIAPPYPHYPECLIYEISANMNKIFG